MGKKSRQRQRHKQQQQQLPPQLEDPASLFPLCSWCGREDHRWRSCPDGPPADWCGRCEADGHSWAGCPHNLGKEQLQTLSSGATPVPPVPPPSPPSQEIWDWLMHPEADLFHDLTIAINTLWRQDGGDMGEAPVKVELPSREPEGEEPPPREPEVEELPSREPEVEEPPSREPEGEEPPSREPEMDPWGSSLQDQALSFAEDGSLVEYLFSIQNAVCLEVRVTVHFCKSGPFARCCLTNTSFLPSLYYTIVLAGAQ
ncbi:UNVERIFIED_CONTAM: hypothetical protein FKN15_037537 [Acipenser sinensis]